MTMNGVSPAAADLGFDPVRLGRVATRIEQDIAAGRYHGAQLKVGRRGRVVLDAVCGDADRATGRRMRGDESFVSFSIGKQFTNVLVLNRIERGDLHLTLRVGEVIPAFNTRGLREINVFQLLTHTSGLMSAIPGVPLEVLTSVEKLTDWVAMQRPESLPGERVNYSIIVAHAVLAELVRRVDGRGRSFGRIITEDLFEPLGMRETSLGPRGDLVQKLCPVVACYEEPGMFYPQEVAGVGQVVLMEGAEVPAGGFLTTSADVHRFATMLGNGGELDGVRILSPRTLEYCARNHTGDRRNVLFDYARDTRGWAPWLANIGIGFFVRGEGLQPGPLSNFSSARTFCGWGAGSTCFWIDPVQQLTFSFLSTGLMEETYHCERLQRLADLVVTSLIE